MVFSPSEIHIGPKWILLSVLETYKLILVRVTSILFHKMEKMNMM